MLTLDAILKTTRQMTSYGEGWGARKCRSGTAARLDMSAAEQTGALPRATPEEGRVGVSPVESEEG